MTNGIARLNSIGILLALAFAYSIIFSFSYATALTYICPNHVGSMFKMAVDVANGLTLYGETYSQYGPVPSWLQAIALTIFGKNVIVSAMTTMAFAFGTIFVLQCVWRRILTFPYLVIAIILQAVLQPDNALPWPNGYLAFFSACTLFFIISYLEQHQLWKLILAGICTSAAILCRQQGIFLFLFVFLSLLFIFNIHQNNIKNRIIVSAYYFLSAILPISIYFTYLQSKHMLIDFYKQTILIIPVAYTSGDISVINHIEGLINNFFLSDKLFFISLWCIISFVAACYMLRIFFNKTVDDPTSRVLFLCSGFALVGLLNAYPLPDDMRYALGMGPATGVLIYFLYSIFSKIAAPLRLVFTVLMIYILFHPAITYCYKNYSGGIHLFRKASLPGFVKLSAPVEIAGTYHPEVNVQFYKKVNNLLNQYSKLYPNTSFISLGVEPLFVTFVANNKNGHQMPFLWWSKTGSMYDDGEKNTINALLYPDYFKKLHAFITKEKPLLYTYGQHIDGYKPIFENSGGVGFPLYWANQWIARPIVSIQAPIDRADKFFASTNTKEFFDAPRKVIISNISGSSSAKLESDHSFTNLIDSRLDTFLSYTSNKPFNTTLSLQLQKAYVISKISLYPRNGYDAVLPRYIVISGSLDGRNWQPIIATYTNNIDATQTGSVFSFKPEKIQYLKIGMRSLGLNKEQFIQISEIILD